MEDESAKASGPVEALALLETVFHNAAVGIAFVDRELRYVRVNEVFAAFHRIPAAAHPGRRVADVVPELWPAIEPFYRRALAGETITSVDLSGTGAAGAIEDWLASYYPARVSGEIVGVGVIVHDITERRRAERALLVRDSLYAMLARSSAAACRAQAKDELFREICKVAVESGQFRFAYVGVPRDGRLEMVASAGDDGGYMAEVVISLDEADPRSRGPAGQAMSTGRPCIVNDFLAAPVTAPWHEAARRAGLAASAGFPILQASRAVALLSVYAPVAGFFTDDLVQTLEQMTPTIAAALDGFDRRDALAREGEERRALEGQLRQSQKMEAVGQLAAGIAHDFNNLLFVVQSYAKLIEEDPGAAPYQGELGEISRATGRAVDLTRQLLAFSRQQVLEPRPIDLRHHLAEMVRMLRRVLGEHIVLALETSRSAGVVLADPGQIEQVVMNLAVNARDAMPDGGKLTMALDDVLVGQASPGHDGVPAGDFVVLTITDTGVGMDAATRERIFEPFFTTKGQGKGTGLGLSTAFGIVKQSEGHIAVTSDVGAGTSFRVYLPRLAEQPAPAAEQQPAAAVRRGAETVLVVEDDEQVRRLTQNVLRRHGYEVLVASGADEAIPLVEKHAGPIHLLLTDVVMPRVNGKDLAALLVRIRPDLKVLYMSGYPANVINPGGVLDDGVAFLQKPVTPSALLSKVRAVIDGA